MLLFHQTAYCRPADAEPLANFIDLDEMLVENRLRFAQLHVLISAPGAISADKLLLALGARKK